MIAGAVTEWDPKVELTIIGPTETITEEAVVDTGYNGDLALSAEMIQRLRLRYLAVGKATLADGSSSRSTIFDALVLWDGEERSVNVYEMGSETLIGMGLLSGFRLIVESVSGEGSLTIERLSV